MPDINASLGAARTRFIVSELLKRGIPEVSIRAFNSGGIFDYAPIEVNRHTRVELHLQPHPTTGGRR